METGLARGESLLGARSRVQIFKEAFERESGQPRRCIGGNIKRNHSQGRLI